MRGAAERVIQAPALDPARCPCCGQALPSRIGIKIDLDTNSAIVDGRAIALQPMEAVLLNVLIEHMPLLVHHDRIMLAMYGAEGGPLGGEALLKVYVARLRQKLARTRLKIVTHWGEGYSARSNG